MKKYFIKILIIIGVAGLSFIAFFNKEELLSLLIAFEKQSMEMPIVAAIILILLKIVAATLGLPGTPLTLLAGSLFGNFFGTIIAIIGNTLGATSAFLLARYILRDYVTNNILTKYPKIKSYDDNMATKGLSTVIALRLIPLFPFNALNFLFGVTSIPLKKYILGSFVGMIPGTIVYVYFGDSLRMLSPFNIVCAIFGILLLTYLGKYFEKRF
jgi:uncharacterized membrane protein YdjX (TVP38/TMEM64 family)